MNESPRKPESTRRDQRDQRTRNRFTFRLVNEITGVFVLVVIATLIACAVWMSHSQRWFKSRVPLRIALPAAGAAGIRQGSEVYFLGTLVGSVSDVLVDATGRMDAQVKIRRDFFRFVRSDSSAVVKRKFGVAGDSFFEITRGEGEPLPEQNASIVCNEQFQSALEAAVEQIRGQTLDTLKKAGAGLDTWTQLGADFGETRQRVEQLTARLERLATGVEQGRGTVGKLLTETALTDEAHGFLARLERMASGVEQGKGTIGKLLTETAVADDAQELLARAHTATSELQEVLANLNMAVKNVQTGTERLPEITAAMADEAKDLPGLVQQTQTSMREMERLVEAMQKSWLVRKHVNHTNPPPRPAPVIGRSKEKAAKVFRSPKDSAR